MLSYPLYSKSNERDLCFRSRRSGASSRRSSTHKLIDAALIGWRLAAFTSPEKTQT